MINNNLLRRNDVDVNESFGCFGIHWEAGRWPRMAKIVKKKASILILGKGAKIILNFPFSNVVWERKK